MSAALRHGPGARRAIATRGAGRARLRPGWAVLVGSLLAGPVLADGTAVAGEPAADAALAARPAPDADPGELKLTLGRYRMGRGAEAVDGTDLNLRWRRDGRTLWLGLYRDGDVGRQARAGWDDQWSLASPVAGMPLQLLPSLQLASGGFVGGSLALQAGGPLYAQLGWGRTNLRPYANLNFDPNDALSAAVGWQADDGRQLQLLVVADDRLHTHQQHHHLLLRWPLPEAMRLTLDLLHKQGEGDAGPVRAWGWTLGVDAGAWFARLARDPKQNFGALDAWRLSAGRRF